MVRIKFYTDNAAFADGNLASEVQAILTRAANHFRLTLDEGVEHATLPLFDVNGNKVGEAKYDA